jgi:hypothetical protein
MPGGMSYTTSKLGLVSCTPETLVAKGLAGCSPNSRLGYGSAFVEVPFGRGAGRELPDIQALMGPPRNGNAVVLFYVNGEEPVWAQLVFASEIVLEAGMFGMSLDTAIPLVPSLPQGPPVSILRVSSTFGPRSLVYYHRVHGRLVGYHPQGIEVPETCPHGGFPFEGEFTFLDGSHAQARTTVPCPPARRRRHG